MRKRDPSQRPMMPSRNRKQHKIINMKSLDGQFIRRFKCITDAARFIDRCPTGFREVIKGRQSTWGGYKWEYAEMS